MDKIIQILTAPMACEPSARIAFMGSLLMALKNGNIQAFEKRLEETPDIKVKAYAYNEARGYVNTVDQWDILDPNLPENSVAILNVEGMTFPWRTFNIENKLQQINNNPRIVGTLLFMNTPGGYIHRIDTLSSLIKNSPKVVASYITGTCASAGQWLSSSTARIFSASKMDVHGSIGVMQTYADEAKMWEEMGIVWTDLYATLSTHKNYKSREAEKGNFEPIIDTLDFLNTMFHKTIAENRTLVIDPESNVFNGKDFYTDEAIKLGLCDQVADLETALNWVLKQGMKNKANNNF